MVSITMGIQGLGDSEIAGLGDWGDQQCLEMVPLIDDLIFFMLLVSMHMDTYLAGVD